jgi:ketosteroid isomerase-like protein
MTTEELEKKVMKLEKRLKTLEDIEDIKKFHLNYIYLYNNHQHEEMAHCFAEDAVLDTGVFAVAKGKEEIARVFRDDIPTVNNWATAHVVVQPVITVDGDRAKGYWTMFLCFFDVATPKGPGVRMYQALHDCEYVKVNGEWKYSSVKFICPWPPQLQCRPESR